MRHVAVVDDDPLFLERISLCLEDDRELHVARARNRSELTELLRSQPIDCVVLDYNLGEETGLVIGHSLVVEMKDAPPIVMLTGEGSERTATKAFRIGFSDYVSKRNLHADELSAAIHGAIERREQEKHSTEEFERLRRQLSFDATTGLHSAAHIAKWLEDHARPREPQFVLAVTVRGLAGLREKLGRDIADRAFNKFAKNLMSATDNYKCVGHLDSDVLVCVPGDALAKSDMRRVVEGLARDLTSRFEVQRVGINLVPVIAGAICPTDGETLMEAAEAARSALDRASKEDPSIAFVSQSEIVAGAAPSGRDSADGDDAQPFEQLTERRQEPRRRMLKHGQILIQSLDTAIDCAIKDMSKRGARLHFDSHFSIPDEFLLRVVGSGEPPRRVVRRWQIGNGVGVEFRD